MVRGTQSTPYERTISLYRYLSYKWTKRDRSRYKMIENFVPKDADHVKGLPRGNRVDQDVAMNANEML